MFLLGTAAGFLGGARYARRGSLLERPRMSSSAPFPARQARLVALALLTAGAPAQQPNAQVPKASAAYTQRDILSPFRDPGNGNKAPVLKFDPAGALSNGPGQARPYVQRPGQPGPESNGSG